MNVQDAFDYDAPVTVTLPSRDWLDIRLALLDAMVSTNAKYPTVAQGCRRLYAALQQAAPLSHDWEG
jgi:hypothetical protein